MTVVQPAAAPLAAEAIRTVADAVHERGVGGPVRLLSPARAWRLAWLLRASGSPGVWDKDRAVGSSAYHRAATEPAILSLVQGVLGPDIILWGSALAIRRPGQPHRWHNDRETVGVDGQSVVVWLPLRNSGPSSSLIVVPGSHRLDESVQQVVAETGVGADAFTDEHVRAWAGERGLEPFDRPVAAPGEAVVFDSRLWHATVNETNHTRVALLLQYATPETEIRVPPTGNFDWPFERSEQRAPCLLVGGSDRFGVNEIADPPDGGVRKRDRLRSHVDRIGVPSSDGTGWSSRVQFRGSTGTGLQMTCHTSVLEPGFQPHPPHTHREEEVLIVLEGGLEVELPPGRQEHLRRGDVVHYPLDQQHTVRALPGGPATYTMFKWDADRSLAASPSVLPTQVVRDERATSSDEWLLELGFAGRTRYLRKLQCHRSTLQPGAGYAPHVDAYDVAVVTLDGTVESLGRRIEPDSVIWYPMGSRHGMRNVGDEPARYVVFEFHGANLGSTFGAHRLRTVPHASAHLARRVLRKARNVITTRKL